MAVSFNHTIIEAHDREGSAAFLTEILGLPAHGHFGPFAVVQVGETSLDFAQTDKTISPRHFAFLVSEPEFDDIFGRIQSRNLPYWADPFHKEPDAINHRDGGRGFYFDDPNGHNLEILTRPYGSGGQGA